MKGGKNKKVVAGVQIHPGWALLCGIVGIVLCVVLASFPFVGMGLSITGLVLSQHARTRIRQGKVSASSFLTSCCTAAFIISLVGTILGAVYVVLFYVTVWATNGIVEHVVGAAGLS